MPFSSGFWRKCRVGFRWLRIAILLAVLALVCALLWFNRIGLPGFLKTPLVNTLRAQGIELQFTRLRLHFVRGFVAENVVVGHAAAPGNPTLSAAEVQLQLDYAALWHRRLELRGLALRRGRFTWPATAVSTLTLTNLQAELRFQTNDTWSLDHFQADCDGIKLALAGEIAHGPEIRHWEIFQGPQPPGPPQPPAALRAITELLDRLHLAGGARFNLRVDGDARDLHSFVVRLGASVPMAQTPWGSARDVSLAADLAVPANLSPPPANIGPQPSLGWLTNFQPYRLTWTLRLAQLRSQRLNAGRLACAGSWLAPDLNLTNLSVVLDSGRFEAQAHLHLLASDPKSPAAHLDIDAPTVQTPWGGARDLRLAADLAAAADAPGLQTASNSPSGDWGWWASLQPYRASWTLRLAQFRSTKLNADSVACAGSWLAPELAVTNFSAGLVGGGLEGQARLNVATHECVFTNRACFDFHATAALLPQEARHWLAQISWPQPPSLVAGGSLVLPPWTNRAPDWRDARQSLRLAGEFAATNVAWPGIAFDAVRSHFSRSNYIWRVPDLVLARTNGTFAVSCFGSDATGNFLCHLQGALDLNALRPLLPTNAAGAFEIISLTVPPAVDADVCGRWGDFDSLGIQGNVWATNFSVRGEAVESFQTRAVYTNRVLDCWQPSLRRTEGQMTADRITVDFNAQRVYFTNGFSTADPQAVAHAIGPDTDRALAPYRFLRPPNARVNGYAPLRGSTDADLVFDVDGGPFVWLNLHSPHVAGQVHWLGQTLILTNVTAAFYGGQGAGFASFDFSVPHPGADYFLAATITSADLHLLASDFSTRTNHLEGALSGTLVLTRADTRDWRIPDGFGHATLRDGLLWDIPIFGVLSPALNKLSPNWGYSRATEAQADFVITNGVIRSDSLWIRTTMMRLDYTGTVDLHGNVNARVTAQLLRNTWIFGHLVSGLLWPVSKLFEYRVTGTLDRPQAKPVTPLLPDLLLLPLHPIRSFEDLLPPADFFTNAPPAK